LRNRSSTGWTKKKRWTPSKKIFLLPQRNFYERVSLLFGCFSIQKDCLFWGVIPCLKAGSLLFMMGRTTSQMEKKKKISRNTYKIFVNFSNKNPFGGAKEIFL
jgi:hypothetical protein